MFRPIRTLISFCFLLATLWVAFTVKLGNRTFAEHMDAISETEPAQDLLEGTREKVHPMLEEVKDRVLGEYVEAPTYLSAPDPTQMADQRTPAPTEESSSDELTEDSVLASSANSRSSAKSATKPSTAEKTKLPGQAASRF